MADDAAVLLLGAGQKTGDILKSHQRDIERVAEAHKPRGFDRRVDVEHAREECRLVGDDTHALSVDTRQAHHDVARKVLVDFKELPAIHHAMDHILHIVRLVGFTGHDGIELGGGAGRGLHGRAPRRVIDVVGWQKGEQLADGAEAILVVVRQKMRDSRGLVVGGGPAQFLLGHLFMGDGLNHLGPGDKHIGGLIHHEGEVGDGRRIHGAPGARPHDRRDLRDHPGGQGVAQENVGISRQGFHPFLNAGPPRIIEPDERRAHAQSGVHQLHDLGGVGFRKGAAEHGEVLRKDENQAPVDAAVPGDETVAIVDFVFHAEISAAVGNEFICFFKAVVVEQKKDAFPRRHFAFLMLARAAFLAAADLGQCGAPLKLVQFLL